MYCIAVTKFETIYFYIIKLNQDQKYFAGLFRFTKTTKMDFKLKFAAEYPQDTESNH